MCLLKVLLKEREREMEGGRDRTFRSKWTGGHRPHVGLTADIIVVQQTTNEDLKIEHLHENCRINQL